VDDLASKLVEIRLSITHPQNTNKVFVLLEGKTDIKLFRKLFSRDCVDTTALNGKSKLVQALEILVAEGYLQVIGIKDADFDHLDNTPQNNNLFVTDYHDMEIEMIESNALDSVIHEFSSENCHNLFLNNMKGIIYDVAENIGYTRWIHEIENNENGRYILRFEGLNYNDFIDVKSCDLKFDLDLFLTNIITHSTNCPLSKEDLIHKIDALKVYSVNKRQLCNGHDLTKLISMIFSTRENSDKRNINQEKIEEAFRLSFHFDDFKQTNLFQNLNLWCQTNDYQIFCT